MYDRSPDVFYLAFRWWVFSPTLPSIHFSARMKTRLASVDFRLDFILGKLPERDTRLSVWEDRGNRNNRPV